VGNAIVIKTLLQEIFLPANLCENISWNRTLWGVKMKTIAFEDAPPGRILYIEDDKDSREMLVLMLEDAGYAMSTATSVADGLSLARLERFDLYILDSRFADGSGVDLCRQIRAFDPLTPIIFYSSSAYPADIATGLSAGAQEYLLKPMGIYTIIQTIAELLTVAKIAPVAAQKKPSRQQENGAGRGYSDTPVSMNWGGS
jgi:DNA-binding response OmpR family regulator